MTEDMTPESTNPFSESVWHAGKKFDQKADQVAAKINSVVQTGGQIFDAVTGEVSDLVNAAATDKVGDWEKQKSEKLGTVIRQAAQSPGTQKFFSQVEQAGIELNTIPGQLDQLQSDVSIKSGQFVKDKVDPKIAHVVSQISEAGKDLKTIPGQMDQLQKQKSQEWGQAILYHTKATETDVKDTIKKAKLRSELEKQLIKADIDWAKGKAAAVKAKVQETPANIGAKLEPAKSILIKSGKGVAIAGGVVGGLAILGSLLAVWEAIKQPIKTAWKAAREEMAGMGFK